VEENKNSDKKASSTFRKTVSIAENGRKSSIIRRNTEKSSTISR